MSLRAIKKREIGKPYKKHLYPSRTKKFTENRTELRKLSKSYPDLTKLEKISTQFKTKIGSKSETDVTNLEQKFKGNLNKINAKSEVCLETISVHSTIHSRISNMVGTQSERNLSEINSNNNQQMDHDQRRMSEQSLSAFSNRTSNNVRSTSELGYPIPRGCVTNSSHVRIPIIGYEVMEERARFTVYKLRVENPFTNDCWLVLRRYTDFVRLNSKLRQAFPSINLPLPRKKIFGDNFNSVFLDNRVQGLQIFVNSIMSNSELKHFKLVREFFCLDEPPTYSESMEECRAIFEGQEETISHLKMQINNKNEYILSLQQKLREEIAAKEQLKIKINDLTERYASCSIGRSAKL